MPFSRRVYPKRLNHACIYFKYGWSQKWNPLPCYNGMLSLMETDCNQSAVYLQYAANTVSKIIYIFFTAVLLHCNCSYAANTASPGFECNKVQHSPSATISVNPSTHTVWCMRSINPTCTTPTALQGKHRVSLGINVTLLYQHVMTLSVWSKRYSAV